MEKTDNASALTQKIMRISTINAWSITLIAGSFTLLSLIGLSVPGVIVGAAVTAAGFMEMHGQKALQEDPGRARTWMVGSQVWLMACVLIYCGWRLLSLDPDNPFVVFGDAGQVFQLVEALGIPMKYLASLFIQAFYITYSLIAGLTILFQGGLALYYRSRIGRLVDAHTSTVSAPTGPQPGN